jgi:hypothetical protein
LRVECGWTSTQSVTIIPEGNEVRSVVVTMKRGDAPACPRTCDGLGLSELKLEEDA